MAMLGLQADMQQRSEVPGCITAWDLNLEINGTVWPADNVGGILKIQYYNGTLPISSDLNVVCYKDLFKQTMLKHEAEFRDQIHELHRLYMRQKELMDEMKKDESYKHHLSLENLQPKHVLSPNSSRFVQRPQNIWTSTNRVHCQSPVSEAKDSKFPFHYYYDKNRRQASQNPTRLQSSSTAPELLETNCKMFGKKILDLELPADEYIDSEEEGFSAVEMAPEVTDSSINDLKKIPEARDRGDKKLPISGSGCNSVLPEGNSIPSSISSKARILADLNIPAKLEEDLIPELIDFEDPAIGQRETSLQVLSGKSYSNFQVQPNEVSPNIQMKDPVDVLTLDKHNNQRASGTCNDKAGSGAGNVSAGSHKLVAASDMCSSYQIVPLAETMNSYSSSVSSWRRDFKRSPIAVQALPCFKGESSKSFTGSPKLAANEISLSKNWLSSPMLGRVVFPQASWQNDCQLEGQSPTTSSVSLNCNDDHESSFEPHSPAKYTRDFKCEMSVKSLDLNSVLPSFSTIVAVSQDSSHIHGEKTSENSTGCSPQIAEIPECDGKSGERIDQSIPLECGLKQANTVCLHDAGLEKVEASNSLDCKRILEIHMQNIHPIANGRCSSHASTRNYPNSSAKEDIKDKEKDRIPDIDLECDHVPEEEKQEASAELIAESEPCEKYSSSKVLIDLNCLSLDESLLMSSESMQIDLEPAASPENKEISLPRGESDEKQLEMPLVSSGQEDGDLQDVLVRIAVEALVSISSSEIQTCLESIICEPFKASEINSLYWFARVASSVVDDPGSEFGVNIGVKDCGDEEYLSDGIDYFEAMTLNLPEMKVDEYWCKSYGQKEEDQSAVFLRNQPKRVRTRRGRQQRKDFQSEILPSMSSLSRFEVTEDLQLIGGLMEAAGAQWESGSSRNAGRNGHAKGRRRSNTRAFNRMESMVNTTLLKEQSLYQKVGIQQRRLMEWGKITRRPRGPRCPSSNPRLILGQV